MTRSAPDRDPMPHRHRERPANALAHGPAKARDIEHAREQVAAAEQRQSRLAARYWQDVIERAVEVRATLPKRLMPGSRPRRPSPQRAGPITGSGAERGG